MKWWWKRMVRRPQVLAPVREKIANEGDGISKLHEDIQTCEYEDILVMWEMLRKITVRKDFVVLSLSFTNRTSPPDPPTPPKHPPSSRNWWSFVFEMPVTLWARRVGSCPMEDRNGKSVAGGQEFTKRCPDRSFTDPKHGNFQYRNRTGCSIKDNAMKSTKCSIAEKLKQFKPSLLYKSGNTDVASSSSSKFDSRCHKMQNKESFGEEMIVENSIREGCKEEWLELYLDFHKREAGDFVGLEAPSLHSFSVNSTPSSSSGFVSSAKYGKQVNQGHGLLNDGTERSSLQQSYVPRGTYEVPKTIPHGFNNRSQRYEIRNLNSVPISGVIPSGSPSDGRDKRVVSVRKMYNDGEGCSSGVKSLQGQEVPQNNSMRSQTQINDRSDPVSVRTSLSTRGEISRRRFKEQEHEHIVQTPDPILFPQRSHASLSISEVVPERSMLPSAMRNLSLGGRPAYSSSGSQSRPVSYSECRDDYRLFNMERITEVLQSLERFDQDGDLRYEQLMLLESNLFLEGFSFNDQHRDMRMDIDNMTYEDLLALEEKMGSVSTALPEEAFSKCLKRSTFRTCYPCQESLVIMMMM
ncbi:hypothetical protein HPP92_010459 [Vanilla planifolia]|uniref:RING-type E3 ubiquitin transferase n=1 Tax=Vanilla planifolia TaxID=51239 RepID=A0A835QTY4_VANPL|nr:hypothetical protein HPP92_010459 [Vanilla planifolia]